MYESIITTPTMGFPGSYRPELKSRHPFRIYPFNTSQEPKEKNKITKAKQPNKIPQPVLLVVGLQK